MTVVLLLAGAAWAQAPRPEAAASAAMERAQRIAANPMRVILEASKFKRKPVEPEAADEGAADASNLHRTPARAADAEAKLTAAGMRAAPTLAEVPALAPAAAAAVVTAMPKTAAPLAELAATLVRPKLVTMVEPQVPQRVLDEIGGAVQVFADVTINSDGSVAHVELVPPVQRSLQRFVVAALQQWRFEPLATSRVHRVQLIFNER